MSYLLISFNLRLFIVLKTSSLSLAIPSSVFRDSMLLAMNAAFAASTSMPNSEYMENRSSGLAKSASESNLYRVHQSSFAELNLSVGGHTNDIDFRLYCNIYTYSYMLCILCYCNFCLKQYLVYYRLV